MTFAPGVTSMPVTVLVNGDVKNEADETFTVGLSNPTNATIGDNSGTGTITNDDAVPTVSIDDPSLTEGNAGTTTFTFNVTLSDASSQAVTVDYATADGTGTTADGDYTAASCGHVRSRHAPRCPLPCLSMAMLRQKPTKRCRQPRQSRERDIGRRQPRLSTITNDDAVVLTSSTASQPINTTTVTIAGTGFDPVAANNTVVFNDGAVGTVTAATDTSLTVTLHHATYGRR